MDFPCKEEAVGSTPTGGTKRTDESVRVGRNDTVNGLSNPDTGMRIRDTNCT